jgi:hypothetical protein
MGKDYVIIHREKKIITNASGKIPWLRKGFLIDDGCH